jgi:hypothetical protein
MTWRRNPSQAIATQWMATSSAYGFKFLPCVVRVSVHAEPLRLIIELPTRRHDIQRCCRGPGVEFCQWIELRMVSAPTSCTKQ